MLERGSKDIVVAKRVFLSFNQDWELKIEFFSLYDLKVLLWKSGLSPHGSVCSASLNAGPGNL